MNSEMNPLRMTVQEYAEYRGVHQQSIYHAIWHGMPTMETMGKICINRDAADRWMRQIKRGHRPGKTKGRKAILWEVVG